MRGAIEMIVGARTRAGPAPAIDQSEATPDSGEESAGDHEVDGLRALALLVGLDVETDALSLSQRLESGTLDRRDVNEHVAPTVVWLDEAVATLTIEKLDRTGLSHREAPYPQRSLRCRPPRHGSSAQHSQSGIASAQRPRSLRRPPPREAERQSQRSQVDQNMAKLERGGGSRLLQL